MRGDGSVYRRGKRWWIAYYVDGNLRREPAGTSKAEAKAKLKMVHTAQRDGSYLTPAQRQLTVDDLLDDLVTRLRNNKRASIAKVASHLRAVRSELGKRRAVDLDTSAVEHYQAMRLA